MYHHHKNKHHVRVFFLAMKATVVLIYQKDLLNLMTFQKINLLKIGKMLWITNFFLNIFFLSNGNT